MVPSRNKKRVHRCLLSINALLKGEAGEILRNSRNTFKFALGTTASASLKKVRGIN